MPPFPQGVPDGPLASVGTGHTQAYVDTVGPSLDSQSGNQTGSGHGSSLVPSWSWGQGHTGIRASVTVCELMCECARVCELVCGAHTCESVSICESMHVFV